MSSDPLLNVQDIHHSYGSDPVLRGLSFSMQSGERLALMGPSGSGKSTLLNCISGIEKPARGRINFNGLEVTQATEAHCTRMRLAEMTTVFQFFHLLPTLTAFENVELPLQLLEIDAAERNTRVQDLLEAVGVSSRRQARPSELSGGEMQRVAIARALAVRPRLVLADEPTGNLDQANGENVLNLLATLSRSHGFALLMVTHDLSATRICQRVLHLVDGRIDREQVLPANKDSVPIP